MTDADEINKAGEQLYERALKMCGQLGNWTMAANAGGVAFILTTAKDPHLAEQLPLSGAYQAFLFGLVCGFAGHIAFVLTLTVMWTGIARTGGGWERDQLERASQPALAQDMQLGPSGRAVELRDRLRVPLGVTTGGAIGTILYLLAAMAAVYGLSVPLVFGLL